MKHLFLLYIAALFSGCAFLESEEEASTGFTVTQQTDSSEFYKKRMNLLADTNKVSKLRAYASVWNNSCLRMPAGKVLLRNISGDAGYLYLIENFDTLTSKISTEKERSSGPPCSWKQRFKSGITYNINICKESGTSYKIETPCTDKKVLVALVDVIFQQTLNNWNADSSMYKPILEGVGNYYSIEKTSKGTYDLLYTTDL